MTALLAAFLLGYRCAPWLDRCADWLGARLLAFVKAWREPKGVA